jgi:outer membrane protein
MRKLLLLIAGIAITCFSSQADAQTFKFGHINSNEILQILWERDSIGAKLERIEKDLQAMLTEVAAELDKKSTEFSENQDKWSPIVKESRQAELLDMQQRANLQRQQAQTRFQQEHQRLLELLQKKIKDAVDKVAKANNFTYIFDISVGSPLYFNETQSTDIGAQVKKELGVTK